MLKDVVIAAAGRTAIGRFGGTLAAVSAPRLGANVIRALLADNGLEPTVIDEVIMGQVLMAGSGQNPARQAGMAAGLPDTVPATTINQVCGSGLKAIMMAAQAVALGDADVVVAGGQENMSAAPHVLPNSRHGKRLGNWALLDSMIHDGLWDAFNDYHMGQTAENVVEKYRITREEQDEFAAMSQQRAEEAIKHGVFEQEVVPVEVPQRAGDPVRYTRDESPRPGVTTQLLRRLRPAFVHDGTVTAGNSSSLNDGAAAVLVTTARKAQSLGLTPLASITGYATAGVDPRIMGIGPVPATRRCLKKAGWSVDDLELIEANEAFAAQSIAVKRELGWDLQRVNVNGGAIALGHPLGATGCRMVVTLLHEMARRDVHKGLATLCVGGGQGAAVAFER